MLACLVGYVGLRGCNTETPPSGFYINSLAGATLNSFESLTPNEQLTLANLWRNIQERAALAFENEFRSAIRGLVRLASVIDSGTVGYYRKPLQSIAADNALLRGVLLRVSENSDYTELKISTIRFYSDSAVAGMEFFVYDAYDGSLLDTFTQDITVGVNVVYVKKTYLWQPKQTQLFICYDAGLAGTVRTTLGTQDAYCGCNESCNECGCADSYATGGYIAKTEPIIDYDSITKTSEFYGISIDYSINCSLNKFICDHLEVFTDAWVKLLGAELMKERLISERFNSFTLTNQVEAEKFRVEYMSEFKESMKNAVYSIDFSCECCFSDDSVVQTRRIL